jgi:Fic family protein
MKKTKCIICKKEFETLHNPQKTCSKECKRLQDYNLHKVWIKKHPEFLKEYATKNKDKINENQKKNYYKNHKRNLEHIREHRKQTDYKEYCQKWRENNKELFREYAKIDKLKHKQKCLARRLSKDIKIPLGQKCEICNKNLAEEKHHQDYSKPYEINFVCIPCHKKIHRKYYE